MNPVNYDRAATGYAAHRQIHPGVFRELAERSSPRSESKVLEVGCGTGNYIRALVAQFSCRAYGLDPSQGMLARARVHDEPVTWILGGAETLSVAREALDLIFSVDVIHHVSDRAAFYHQAARSLKPDGQICTVTDSETIIRRREILSSYFPETVDKELARYPRIDQIQEWMADEGLSESEIVVVEAPYRIASAEPYREKAYSSLHLIPEAAWQAGLQRLEHDLQRGPVEGVSRYACVWGRRA